MTIQRLQKRRAVRLILRDGRIGLIEPAFGISQFPVLIENVFEMDSCSVACVICIGIANCRVDVPVPFLHIGKIIAADLRVVQIRVEFPSGGQAIAQKSDKAFKIGIPGSFCDGEMKFIVRGADAGSCSDRVTHQVEIASHAIKRTAVSVLCREAGGFNFDRQSKLQYIKDLRK